MADKGGNRDNKEATGLPNKEAIIPIIQAKDVGSTDCSDTSVKELKEELVIETEKTKQSKESIINCRETRKWHKER